MVSLVRMTISKDLAIRTARNLAWLFSLVATLLLMVPFGPKMPSLGLDSSWGYAANIAVAEHLRFGRDIVFTFGPLASVYSRFFHPATDELMLSGSVIIAAAIFGGFSALAIKERRIWLLAVPLYLSQFSRDAQFTALPLLILLVANVKLERPSRGTLPLLLLAIACGLLPLIKASFTLAVIVCTILAVAMLYRRATMLAIAIILIEIFVVPVAWVASGQAIGDLGHYFVSQGPIISGYTEAMSQPGNSSEIYVYLLVAACLMISGWHTWRSSRGWRILGLAVIFFLSFKAGFVRHDGHATLAAAILALVSLALLVERPRGGYLMLTLSLVAWGYISISYRPINPISIARSFSNTIERASNSLWGRVTDRGRLDRSFAIANDQIRRSTLLPPYYGTADLYPWDLSALLASTATWSPRPAFQSYFAYTPGLAIENRQHLDAGGPSRIYFQINPVDKRYPSLDDGTSWPDLIANYRISGYADEYLILDKRVVKPAIDIGPQLFSRQMNFGAEVSMPPTTKPIWALIAIKPTLLGRLVSAALKLPTLDILVRYLDGTAKTFRFIPGMAETGFLLSPTVASSTDFAALESTLAPEILAGKYVKSFEIVGASGSRLLWGKDFTATLSTLNVASDKNVDRVLLNPSVVGTPIDSLPDGGECMIDTLNDVDVAGRAMTITGNLLEIRGWALVSGALGRENNSVALALVGKDGSVRMQSLRKVKRPDVADYFGKPGLIAGFEALVDTRPLEGTYDAYVIQTFHGERLACRKNSLRVTFAHPNPPS
ncbi:hypothetical protein [Rhodanobacter sp. MP7CTX1]|uniref:hypothetical protein n=1 Tax=Rhodanobacter sp. MP7CTX1 TaxID=2723084 RepID=UPI00160ABA93|nr:hypothetical protein [Rhodanobacter sp. MP7CTX1]MBB6187490.1 hypothetical protein [Rhodanobacter sp. MP7CTX1]